MPPKRAKAAAAKHDLPDKSQAIDGPAKKKQKAGGGGAKNVITIDDDEGGPTPDKPEPKQQAKQKNDKEIRIKPESTQVTRLKQIIKPGKSFPRFHDGDVVIVLIHGSTKYSYQLHGSILERASPWFRNMLRLKMQQIEADPEFVANHPIASRLLARFDLDYASELKIPELRRTVSKFHSIFMDTV